MRFWKKIFLPLAACCVHLFVSAQQDSVTVSVKIKNPCKADTVTVSWSAGTLRVPINTPCPVAQDTIWRGLYINDYDLIVGNKSLEDALIRDLNRWKINSIHLYRLSNINGLATKDAQMRLLNTRIRRETKVTTIVATGGSGSTFTGRRTTYNQTSSDSADYDGWNLEYESWNQTDVAAAWNTNVLYLQQMKAGMVAGQVESMTDYFGWWTKYPMTVQTPDTLVKYVNYSLLHDYRTGPDFAYLKSRFDGEQAAAVRQGKQVVIRIIISAEPAFSQTYLKTHTCDDFYRAVYATFKTYNYTNIKLDGYIVFHLDYLRVAQPVPAPAALVRSSQVPTGISTRFQNVTTPQHLKLAADSSEQELPFHHY